MLALVTAATGAGPQGRCPSNRGRRFPIEPLTDPEVLHLLRHVSCTSLRGLRWRALVALLYRAGLRCTEALALHLRDLDAQRSLVNVREGKGGKQRWAGLDPGGMAMVERWLDARRHAGIPDSAPVICTLGPRRVTRMGITTKPAGEPMDPAQVRAWLLRLRRRAGASKRIHAHGFRHSLVMQLAREGVPLHVIRAQLGHVSIATTNRYLTSGGPGELSTLFRGRVWQGVPRDAWPFGWAD